MLCLRLGSLVEVSVEWVTTTVDDALEPVLLEIKLCSVNFSLLLQYIQEQSKIISETSHSAALRVFTFH